MICNGNADIQREDGSINVFGARVHNLKNVDVEIPRNSLTVITGLSGSGKSSLAFDTIYAEGQRRYLETFSAYARNFLSGFSVGAGLKVKSMGLGVAFAQPHIGGTTFMFNLTASVSEMLR